MQNVGVHDARPQANQIVQAKFFHRGERVVSPVKICAVCPDGYIVQWNEKFIFLWKGEVCP